MTSSTVFLIVIAALAGVVVGFLLGTTGRTPRVSLSGRAGNWLRRSAQRFTPRRRRADRAAPADSSGPDDPTATLPVQELGNIRQLDPAPVGDRDRVEYLRSQGESTKMPPGWIQDQHARSLTPAHMPVSRTSARQTATLTHHNGRRVGFRLDPKHLWTVAEYPGLAVDMQVSSVGGILMVSVRNTSSKAYIELDSGRIPLCQVEIPWRSGKIINGEFTLTAETHLENVLAVTRQPLHDRFNVVVLGDWFCITDDQPRLAMIAAHLFIPESLHAVTSWQDRLRAYTTNTSMVMNHEATLIHFRAGSLNVSGDLESGRIGLGRTNDDVPGAQLDLPLEAGPFVFDPSLDRIWVPTTKNSWDKDTCFVLDRSGRA